MKKTKVSIRLPKTAVTKIIDSFNSNLNAYAEHLGNFWESTPVLLFVSAASDHVNENARIIDGSTMEDNKAAYVGIPLIFDHRSTHQATVGNIFYTNVVSDVDANGHETKYMVHAAVIDGFDKLNYTKITEYSKLNFSIGYALNTEDKCPTCSRPQMRFLNIDSHEVECTCGKSFGTAYDVSKAVIGPHNHIFVRTSTGELSPMRSQATLSMSNKKDALSKPAKQKTPNSPYFQIVKHMKPSEVSIVVNAADYTSAPLLAYTTTGDLLNVIKVLSSKNQDSSYSFSGDRQQVINEYAAFAKMLHCDEIFNNYEMLADNENSDNTHIGKPGEKMEKNYLNHTLYHLVKAHPEYADAVITKVVTEVPTTDAAGTNEALQDMVPESLASKYLEAMFDRVMQENSRLSLELEDAKTPTCDKCGKKDVADESKKREGVEYCACKKGTNKDASQTTPPATDGAQTPPPPPAMPLGSSGIKIL